MKPREIVLGHVNGLLDEARAAGVDDDVTGRLLLEAAIGLWLTERAVEDVASELEFAADNLDPEADYAFMRP